ncbi:MAG: TetR/AcrR family transcriptional regulator [Chloroflexi bacterium]|nr:TetR/AcrR family transcriptional regulator [Chloroflexota bacterium]
MQQRSETTRAHILDAARKLFARSGYESASVDAICAEAGVSKGAFYHHFPTKQAIFLQLLENWLSGLETQLETAREGTENVAQVFVNMTALIPGIFRDADQRLPMFLEFWAQASRDKTVWDATISPYRRYRDFFAELIEQGVAEGTFREVNPQIAAEMIVSLAVGTLLQGLLDARGTDWQQTAIESMQIMMTGLAKEQK